MTSAVEQDDPAAHGVAEDDRPGDPEGVAERANVVGTLLEGPVIGMSPVRAAVVAQVEVDDLRYICQAREVGLEVRVVIASGAAVDEDDRRPLAHCAPCGDELRSVDVVPESCPVDGDVHADSSFGQSSPSGCRSLTGVGSPLFESCKTLQIGDSGSATLAEPCFVSPSSPRSPPLWLRA